MMVVFFFFYFIFSQLPPASLESQGNWQTFSCQNPLHNFLHPTGIRCAGGETMEESSLKMNGFSPATPAPVLWKSRKRSGIWILNPTPDSNDNLSFNFCEIQLLFIISWKLGCIFLCISCMCAAIWCNSQISLMFPSFVIIISFCSFLLDTISHFVFLENFV